MEKELMFCLNSHEIILPLSVIFLLKKFYLLFIVQNSIKIKDGTQKISTVTVHLKNIWHVFTNDDPEE